MRPPWSVRLHRPSHEVEQVPERPRALPRRCLYETLRDDSGLGLRAPTVRLFSRDDLPTPRALSFLQTSQREQAGVARVSVQGVSQSDLRACDGTGRIASAEERVRLREDIVRRKGRILHDYLHESFHHARSTDHLPAPATTVTATRPITSA